MSRTIEDILKLIEEKSDYNTIEDDFRVILRGPDVIKHQDFPNVVEVMNNFLHNCDEFQNETFDN